MMSNQLCLMPFQDVQFPYQLNQPSLKTPSQFHCQPNLNDLFVSAPNLNFMVIIVTFPFSQLPFPFSLKHPLH